MLLPISFTARLTQSFEHKPLSERFQVQQGLFLHNRHIGRVPSGQAPHYRYQALLQNRLSVPVIGWLAIQARLARHSISNQFRFLSPVEKSINRRCS